MDQKSQGLGSRGSLCPNSMTYTLYSSRAGPLTPWGLCLYHSLSLECQIQNAYPPLSLARPPKSSVLSFGQFCSGREEFIGSVPTVRLVSRTAFSMRVAASEASRTVLHTPIPSKPSPSMHTASWWRLGSKEELRTSSFPTGGSLPCQYV